MSADLRLGRIGGVDVSASWGLVAISTVFTVSLAADQYPDAFPGYGTATYWLAALTATLLFVASILLHELGHALVARREAVPVEGVTLWMFGGLARLGAPPPTPGADARISLAGPAATGLAAGGFWLAATAARATADPSLLGVTFDWLARTNLLLAGLNLLPALPLDGGNVTRAALWRLTSDRTKGALYASRLGWLVALALIAFGARATSRGEPFGLWALMVAWLVISTSRSIESEQRLRRAWDGRTAAELMAPYPPMAEAWMTVEAMMQYLAAHPGAAHHALYPVRDDQGRVVGAVRRGALEAVPEAARRQVRVIDVAEPRRDVPVVAHDAPIAGIVEAHPEALSSGVLVTAPTGETIGVLGPAQLLAAARPGARAAAR